MRFGHFCRFAVEAGIIDHDRWSEKTAFQKIEAPSNTVNTVSLTHSTGALKHGRLSLEPHPIQQVCGGSA